MARNAQWGEDKARLERFIIDGAVQQLSGDFADNEKIALLETTDEIVLFVEYTKGSENLIEIEVAFADRDVGEDVFFVQQIAAASGTVSDFIYRISGSRNLRLPIPVTVREYKMRVRVRKQGGPPLGTGVLELFYGTNNLSRKLNTGDTTARYQ